MGTKIGNLNLASAFVGDKAIQKIYVGNDLKWSAEEDLFYVWIRLELTSLSAEQLGEITQIGDHAFSGQQNLISIEVPNGVTTIGEYAFSGCVSLTSVILPSTITTLKSYSFLSCSSLTSIVYNSTTENWNNVVLEQNWNLSATITEIICTNGTITL